MPKAPPTRPERAAQPVDESSPSAAPVAAQTMQYSPGDVEQTVIDVNAANSDDD